MPPKAKESVAARRARERAEAAALLQHEARQSQEIEEDKARRAVELNERVEYLEALNQFYHRLVSPASRLMVPRRDYEAARAQMQEAATTSAERSLLAQERHEHMTRAHEELSLELAHLRNDTRKMAETMRLEAVRMRARVEDRLDACAADINDRILSKRRDALECSAHLNTVLEENMVRILGFVADAKRTAQLVTTLQQEQSSLHSRIPRRIRTLLLGLEREDLVLILDTLSFEESTLEYLLCRYPPQPDDPFLNKTGF